MKIILKAYFKVAKKSFQSGSSLGHPALGYFKMTASVFVGLEFTSIYRGKKVAGKKVEGVQLQIF